MADPTRMYGLVHEDDFPRVRAAELEAPRDGKP